MKIDNFSGDFAFLSNFYPSPIKIDGKTYQTVEHYFQAFKACTINEQEKIRMAKTPKEAKKFGRETLIRPDWEVIKESIMEIALRQKFSPDGILAERLIETGFAELIEGNNWNDCFWGVCKGEGKNKLGQLLMKIRCELTYEKAKEIFVELNESD
jgi:ribA/ribD-fused uncharacterized protein